MDADAGAAEVTSTILRYAKKFKPQRMLLDRKSSHPWVNDRIVDPEHRKTNAESTNDEHRSRNEYDARIREEYLRYVARELEHLKSMAKSSEAWWRRAHKLLRHQERTCTIPALRGRNGEWLMEISSLRNTNA